MRTGPIRGHQHCVRSSTSRRASLRALLSRPAYRRLWVARMVSQVGDVAQFTTLALLIVALTGSGLGVTHGATAKRTAVGVDREDLATLPGQSRGPVELQESA